jgi:uncharacterized protein YegP (UPF0339 family)
MKVILKKGLTKEPYTFAFIDSEGKSVVRSENYQAKKGALNGIASIKKNCVNDRRYETKETKNGKFYFNVKASNGQVVGTSAFFSTMEERSSAVARFKADAADAAVEEVQA